MRSIESGTVESYLLQYGWNFHLIEPSRWISGWQSEERSYPLEIKLTDTWLSFSVKPLIKVNVDWESWPEILKFLMELNNDTQFVKLGIDGHGDLSLGMQLFASQVNYDEFSDALGILGHYAEVLYDHVMRCLNDIGYTVNLPEEFLI